VYVDAFLRGAEIISINPIGSGNYETIIEIEADYVIHSLTK